MSDSISAVDLRIDPVCPWAWLTSRWLAEVSRIRGITVRTRLFSLAEVNRGESGRLEPSHQAAQSLLRALVAARRSAGDDGLARLYTELGEAIHERGEAIDTPEASGRLVRRALRDAGLDEGLGAGALEDPTTLDELVAEHHEAVAAGAFGVPTLEANGHPALFGPIVDRRLDEDEAAALWDHVVFVLRNPHVLELKRARPQPADVGSNRARALAS